jgi:hypothetical protein
MSPAVFVTTLTFLGVLTVALTVLLAIIVDNDWWVK